MKTVILILSLLIPFLGLTQEEIFISNPVSITDSVSTYGKHLPRLEAFQDGSLIVFWSKQGTSPKLYTSKFDGQEWSDPNEIDVGNLSPDVWGASLGPDMTVSGDTVYIAFEEYGTGVYSIRSTDKGQTFEAPVLAYTPEAGRFATLPIINADAAGNPIISFVTTNSVEGEALYEIVQSNDGGLSYEYSVVVNLALESAEVCECCPASLAAATANEMYISFRNNDEGIRDIWVAKSTDGGQTFAEVADIDETDWYTLLCPNSGPSIYDSGSTLFSAFFSNSEDWESGVYVSTLDKSTMLAGSTLKLPLLPNGSNNQNFPVVAGRGDTIGVVWHETVSFSRDVALAYTTQGSADSLATKVVNLTDALGSQSYPDIKYSSGKFHIVYEDQISNSIMYQSASFDPLLSTEALEPLQAKVSIFPNPSKESTTIRIIESEIKYLNIEITNALGQSLWSSSKVENQVEINIKDWSRGVYFIRIFSGNKNHLEKLIID